MVHEAEDVDLMRFEAAWNVVVYGVAEKVTDRRVQTVLDVFQSTSYE